MIGCGLRRRESGLLGWLLRLLALVVFIGWMPWFVALLGCVGELRCSAAAIGFRKAKKRCFSYFAIWCYAFVLAATLWLLRLWTSEIGFYFRTPRGSPLQLRNRGRRPRTYLSPCFNWRDVGANKAEFEAQR